MRRWLFSPTGLVSIAGGGLLIASVLIDDAAVLVVPAALALVLTVARLAAAQARRSTALLRELRRLEGAVDALDDRIGQLSRFEEVEQQARDAGRVGDALTRRTRDLEVRVTEVTSETRAQMNVSSSTLEKLGRSTEARDNRIVDRLRDLEVRVTGVSRKATAALAQERSDRSLLMAHTSDPALPVRRVLLLMTLHRSGSTRLFDLLRSHPATRVEPTAHVWSSLGLRGRRYPEALSDGPDARIPLEIQLGAGAGVPSERKWDGTHTPPSDRWVLEKAHPQFVDFDAAALIDAVQNLTGEGVEVRLVYNVREPLAAMWSMAEFKQRDPNWYAFLDTADVPDWMHRSLGVIEALHSELGGHVVDFDDLRDGASLRSLGRMLDSRWTDDDSSRWLEFAAGEVARSADARPPSTFVGERDPERGRTGPGGIWGASGEIIDSAEDIHRRLVARDPSSPPD